jgi:hypothetical protein
MGDMADYINEEGPSDEWEECRNCPYLNECHQLTCRVADDRKEVE